MFLNISKEINWLKENISELKDITRGIERETLRVDCKGNPSLKNHPGNMGSTLTHKWITTDFSENLIEFITPKNKSINYIIKFLQDLYKYSTKNIYFKERLWPLSIPYYNNKNTKINIARYGNSDIGILKEIYRKGLKNRYGNAKNIIAGIHYNFSFPLNFWKKWKNIKNIEEQKKIISTGYLGLIRNYYRVGWIIPLLFGSSPALPINFLENKINKNIKFKKHKKNFLYLPWSTSIRTSNIGYNNDIEKKILKIHYNSLDEYITKVKFAKNTPYKKFIEIGKKDEKGCLKQLNTNLIQIESELYAQIRPKQSIQTKEKSIINSLEYNGIEYVEIRSIDVNPFQNIGIEKKQLLFIDLLIIWCTLSKSKMINTAELHNINKNWEIISLYGKKPNQSLFLNDTSKKIPIIEICKFIFQELKKIANILDNFLNKNIYQKSCLYFENFLYYPELSYSSRILKKMKRYGFKTTGLKISNNYYYSNINKNYSLLEKKTFLKESKNSYLKKKFLEKM
ncbi:glutamate--cysteine ligase [Buchnera aphidicola (Kurisakia onigurumii)]|uniref:glutamate--cysteine ligase n=1 Tax=Buchnera aphidicola TaxID=9 RepID=UPI0031B690D6